MMKEYIVTLKATSKKTIEIRADSKDEALEMIEVIYFRTDAVQFATEDIEVIDVDAELSCGEENYNPDECEECIHVCQNVVRSCLKATTILMMKCAATVKILVPNAVLA